jgi:hypothetical protein
MKPAPHIEAKPVGPAEEGVKTLIALIDELIAVVIEENVELSKGLPASRSKQVDEKTRLADVFGQRVAACTAQAASLNVKDRFLREQLTERMSSLRAATDENLMRLRAAIDASNRRIEAVMQAIREQIASVSPYGAAGRRKPTRSVSCTTNVRA